MRGLVVRAPADQGDAVPVDLGDALAVVPADQVDAPAPADQGDAAPADWSTYVPQCGKTRQGFRAHSRRPDECRMCGQQEDAHRDDTVPAVAPAPAAYGVFAHSPAGTYPVRDALSVHATETDAEAWRDDNIGDGSVGNGRALVVEPLPAGDQVDAAPAPAVYLVDVAAVPAAEAPAGDQVDQVDTVPAPAAVPAAEAPAPVVPTRTPDDTVTAGSVPAGKAGIMRAVVDRKAFIAALAYVAQRLTGAYRWVTLSVVAGTLHVSHTDGEHIRTVALPAGAGAIDGSVSVLVRAADVKRVPGVKVGRARTLDLVADAAGALTVIGQDGASAEFAPATVVDLPAPETDHVIGTVAARDLVDMISRAASAAGTDETLPMMTGVQVGTDGKTFGMIATDRYRLHVAAGTWSPATDDSGYLVAPGSAYLVPARQLSDFGRAVAGMLDQVDTVAVTVGETLAGGMVVPAYGLTAGTLSLVVTCLDGGNYPPVQQLFPSHVPGSVSVPAGALVDLVDGVVSDCAAAVAAATEARAAAVAAAEAAGTDTGEAAATVPAVEKTPSVILFFAGNQVTAQYGVTTVDGDTRPAATRTMTAGEIVGTLPDYIGFNPAYLVDAVRAAAGRDAAGDMIGNVTLDLISSANPAVIRGDDMPAGTKSLIMPIRVTVSPLGTKDATVDQVKRPAPAAEAPAVTAHAFTPGISQHRCALVGCGAGRGAAVHAAAAAEARRERAERIAAGRPAAVPAAEAPAPAVDQVDTVATGTAGSVAAEAPALAGPVVAGAGSVDLVDGVIVVAAGGTVGRIVRRIRRHRVDGFDLMISGRAYTSHYGATAVRPAVIGDNVCTSPERACSCGMVHVPAGDLVKLPRLATVPAGDQVDTVPAAEAPAPAARDLVDGRAALAGMVAPITPEKRAVAILPAGALAAVPATPRPADFNPYRDDIGGCECPLCNEVAYVRPLDFRGTEALHAARVLLAHLVAGTHVRMTLADAAAEARAHRADMVAIAEASGVTGDALDRVRDPHTHAVLAARSVKWYHPGAGLGIGIGDAPIRAEGEARRAAERAAATPRADEVPAVAAVLAAEAPAPAVDQVDTVAPETAGSVAAEAPAPVRLVFAGTVPAVDQVDTVPAAEAPAPAGDQVDGETLHGAHPADVDVWERGTVAGYRFHVVAGTRTKSMASDQIRPAIREAGFSHLVSVTAPAKSRTVNVVPKEGATVTDWPAVLAVVAGIIGDALAGDACECDSVAVS